MKLIRSCSWCHIENECSEGSPCYCRSCGHRAELPRLQCDCATCKLRARVMSKVDTVDARSPLAATESDDFAALAQHELRRLLAHARAIEVERDRLREALTGAEVRLAAARHKAELLQKFLAALDAERRASTDDIPF